MVALIVTVVVKAIDDDELMMMTMIDANGLMGTAGTL
jgi:hypothetical protein